jgi:predicted house-cleaning noncanonical NTP pyrophosphatase (MazG superfamily)
MDLIPADFLVDHEFPKLVRDRVPEIIEKAGLKPEILPIADDDQFLKYLLKKMVVESIKLQHSQLRGNTQEELADVLEVIYIVLKLKNWTMEDIAAVQKEKREKKGGFDKRLLLLLRP